MEDRIGDGTVSEQPKGNPCWITDKIAKSLKVQSLQDWYRVVPSDVKRKGGEDLLKAHNGSLISRTIHSLYITDTLTVLQQTYPEQDWHFWSFRQPTIESDPEGWKNISNQRKYIHWLADQVYLLEVKWY